MLFILHLYLLKLLEFYIVLGPFSKKNDCKEMQLKVWQLFKQY